MTKRQSDPPGYKPKRPVLPAWAKRWEIWLGFISVSIGGFFSVIALQNYIKQAVVDKLDSRYVTKAEVKPLTDTLNAHRWQIKRIEKETK